MLSLPSLLIVAIITFVTAQDDLPTYKPIASHRATPSFFPKVSERFELSYGPFKVPSMHVDGGMIGYEGHMPNPCGDGQDCLVTWMRAGLEYTNGSVADADTGMWLHHTVLYNLDRLSLTCADVKVDDFQIPEPVFASGNERTAISICANGTSKTGYHVHADENLYLTMELMNMTPEEEDVVLTITYEYIPTAKLSSQSGFKAARPLWLDVGACTEGSNKPAKPNTKFTYRNHPEYKSTIVGEISFMAGHLHDGGTHITVKKNRRDVLCDSVAKYGDRGGHHSHDCSGDVRRTGHGHDHHGHGGGVHVSHITTCNNPGRIEIGDKLGVTAYYDTTLHEPMEAHDGGLEPVMGIAIAYVACEEVVGGLRSGERLVVQDLR